MIVSLEEGMQKCRQQALDYWWCQAINIHLERGPLIRTHQLRTDQANPFYRFQFPA